MESCIVYVGDFDFRNENVQSHLVKNNGKIFASLGYHVEYIGVNRKESSFETVASLPTLQFAYGHQYLELPETLNVAGLFKCLRICKIIIDKLNELKKRFDLSYVITYQSPTYAVAVKRIADWCKKNSVCYIVNCADLPMFDLQSPIRKIVMKSNWNYLHKINQKYADGVIAVSKFIADFYSKPMRACVVVPPLFDSDEFNFECVLNNVATFVYAGTPFKITGREITSEGMKDRLDKIIDLFLSVTMNGVKYIFDIVGITKEEYIACVPRHAYSLASADNIRFLGRMSHDDTIRKVAQADFSINYRDENLMTKAGLSTKVVESVSVGTPVIMNPIGDTFEYLSEGVSGFALMGELNSDSDLLRSLCVLNAEERANIKNVCLLEESFSLERYRKKLKDFFEMISQKE